MRNPLKSKWQQQWLRLEATCPEFQAAADAVEQWCGRMFRNKSAVPRMLVLSGESGCGKTRLLNAAHKWAQASAIDSVAHGFRKTNPASVHLIEWTRIAECKPYDDAISDLVSYDVVFLDDIGTETDRFRSHEAIELLRYLLGRRDTRDKWTMLTTNVPPENWQDVWDVRVCDRLLRNSSVIDMRGIPSFAEVAL